MLCVSRFFQNAVELFAAAERSSAAGERLSDTTILISRAGAIHMVVGSDRSLDHCQAGCGEGMAYRISQQGARVRVEGRAGSRTCLFETAKPDGAARPLLAESLQTLLRPAVVNPDMPSPASARLLPAARS